MASAVEPIIHLNAEINEASLENNFSRILLLDTRRRALITGLATNPDFISDEKSLTILRKTAEENQVLVTDITERMTALTKITSNKIRMLRSYRQTK